MANYCAEVLWQRHEQMFVDQGYSRKHLLRFDGGLEIAGSSSPHVVPVPYSDPAALDPEEAFISALASCHMLWFLALAAKQGWVVESYHDCAQGQMGRNAQGKTAMTQVLLRPEVRFSGASLPSRAEVHALHHRAHDACFIANSVTTTVLCEPREPNTRA